jgi:chromate transporter
MSTNINLFWSFFKIGFFTFGGGLAMIPFIEEEFIEKKRWVSRDDMTDMIALSQSFPGVIAVNVSIFVGQKIAGKTGAIMAVAGTVLPALLSIILIMSILAGFENNTYVKMVFVGIKAASAALILDSVVKMIRKAVNNTFGAIIAAIGFIIVMINYSAAWSVVIGALAGLWYYRKRESL